MSFHNPVEERATQIQAVQCTQQNKKYKLVYQLYLELLIILSGGGGMQITQTTQLNKVNKARKKRKILELMTIFIWNMYQLLVA